MKNDDTLPLFRFLETHSDDTYKVSFIAFLAQLRLIFELLKNLLRLISLLQTHSKTLSIEFHFDSSTALHS